MHITSLRLENFRGFESLDLTFDDGLTVLVGRNASGKSSILDAIASAAMRLASDRLGGRELPGRLSIEDIREDRDEAVIASSWSDGTKDYCVRMRRESGEFHLPAQSVERKLPPLCLYFGSDRVRTKRDLGPAGFRGVVTTQSPAWDDDVHFAFLPFEIFVQWFREREDIENQQRVQSQDLTRVDPALDAVRRAIAVVLGDGYKNPRIDREGGARFVVNKAGAALSISQLSDGERSLLILAGNIARRLSLLDPRKDALAAPAIVLIDEVELHLHPAWQRKILTSLCTTFPACQFVASTHSPTVLSEVKTSSVRMLEDFKIYTPAQPVRGRDANALLREVFGEDERPAFMFDMIHEVSRSIDAGKLEEAYARLADVEKEVGSNDSEVIRIRMMLDFLTDDDEPKRRDEP